MLSIKTIKNSLSGLVSIQTPENSLSDMLSIQTPKISSSRLLSIQTPKNSLSGTQSIQTRKNYSLSEMLSIQTYNKYLVWNGDRLYPVELNLLTVTQTYLH